MDHITNGSMLFDPKLHTLSFIRSRSSFLLAAVLACATVFKPICADQTLHLALTAHVARLVAHVKVNSFKSIEIVQALLSLATYTDVSSSLCHDPSWSYISYAIALAIELRLDIPVPFCVQADLAYSSSTHELLVRNAHRTCLLLFIHDRVSCYLMVDARGEPTKSRIWPWWLGDTLSCLRLECSHLQPSPLGASIR